jgi:hypothetical protein
MKCGEKKEMNKYVHINFNIFPRYLIRFNASPISNAPLNILLKFFNEVPKTGASKGGRIQREELEKML